MRYQAQRGCDQHRGQERYKAAVIGVHALFNSPDERNLTARERCD
jgi:hypothetical protein